MRRSSDVSKASILAAARERFAVAGYDRATIRDIAAQAAIDPAMIMRYFGNKQQLFLAAAQLDLRLPDLAAVPRRAVGRTLVTHFLGRWESDDALKLLLRTAATNETAAARMRTIFATQLFEAVARLHADPSEAAQRAGLVAVQMMGLALCRYLLQLQPVAAMTHDEIVNWLGPTLQRYLVGSRKTPRRGTARRKAGHPRSQFEAFDLASSLNEKRRERQELPAKTLVGATKLGISLV